MSAGISSERKHDGNQRQQRQVGEVGKLLEHVLIDRVVQRPVGGPESEERDACLHEDALQDVPMHVVSEFVREHGLDFISRIVVEQGVGQNDAARVAQSSQRRVRLFALLRKFPAINAAHPRSGALA